MSKLEKLIDIDGALAAFEFNPDGELQASSISGQSKIEDDVLELLCHVCVANGAIATMQARGWEKMTKMEGFYPIQGFSLIGFEWTVLVSKCFGVIIANDKVDYDGTYAVLDES